MSRFLQHYQNYISKVTDAPYEYAEAAGLSMLSAISLGRRKLDRGRGIHPNLFTLLMADSSADRKSTSIDYAIELLRDVEEDRVGPDDFTPEALLYMMRDKPPAKGVAIKARNKMLVPLPEFGLVLAQAGVYAATMQTTLCKVYDAVSFERVRVSGGETRITDPLVSLLGGCAFEMMREYGKESDWSNGFYARCLFITPQTKPPQFATQPVRMQGDYDHIRMLLTDIRNAINGTPNPHLNGMQLLPGAEAVYNTFMKTIPEDRSDVVRTAQRERLFGSTLKLAILYQLDDDPNGDIGAQAMDRATAFATKAWTSFEVVYERVSGSARNRISEKIWKLIAAAGPEGISSRDLSKRVHLKVNELEGPTTTLANVGVIRKVVGPKGGLRFFVIEAPEEP